MPQLDTSTCKVSSSGRPILDALTFVRRFSFLVSFLCGDGLDLWFVNFRQERLGCGRNWHFAQQGPSGDAVSVHRTAHYVETFLLFALEFSCEAMPVRTRGHSA
jgi:hypothetical protein